MNKIYDPAGLAQSPKTLQSEKIATKWRKNKSPTQTWAQKALKKHENLGVQTPVGCFST